MRHLSVFISFVLFLITFSLPAQTLQKNLDELIEQTLPHANVGVMIQDVSSGQILSE